MDDTTLVDAALDPVVRDPVRFVRGLLRQDLWDLQAEILRAVAENPRTAVKACHASGKTFVAAAAVLWWITRFRDGIVVTTAPTWTQVEKLLWGEIHRAIQRSRIQYPQPNRTELRLGPNNYAIGLSTNEGVRFQGFHGEHILVVLDEAPGVLPEIWEADTYANRRAEFFWGLRMRFQDGQVAGPTDERAISQLAGILYKHDARGRVVIESKDDARKRGVKSPDRADAVMLAFAEPALGWTVVGLDEDDDPDEKPMGPFTEQLYNFAPHLFERPPSETCATCIEFKRTGPGKGVCRQTGYTGTVNDFACVLYIDDGS